MRECGLDKYALRQGLVAGCYEHNNELLGPIKSGDTLGNLRHC